MTDNQLIELTKKLIAIQSTSDNPAGLREAYDFMVDLLRSSGKDITIEEFESDGKPSFIAYRDKKRPAKFRIILAVHVDVVPGQKHQYNAKVKDGKLYGRGAHDEKAAAVILADLFCEYVDKVPYNLAFQVVTDEEMGGYNGARVQIEKHGVRGDFIICAECGRSTTVHEIANEAKGILTCVLSFRGNAAHGAYPWRGDNAAARAANFITALHQKFPIPFEESPETTFTVTAMTASGEALNRVPDLATVGLDIRYSPDDQNFNDRTCFAKLIHGIDPAVEIEYSLFDSPLYCNPNNPLLQTLKAAAEEVEGAPFNLVRRHATSDGRHFGDVGNEAIEFGVAGEHQHGDSEYVTLEAFSNYRKTMRHFLDKTIDQSIMPIKTRPKAKKDLILT